MVLKNGISYVDEGPFRSKLNLERIQKLLSEGVIFENNLEDIGVLAWASIIPTSHRESNFLFPFIDLNKSCSELSFIEKVAMSFSMMEYGLRGCMNGRGSSYGYKDYITSDYDIILGCGTNAIVDVIKKNSNNGRVRVNHTNPHNWNSPFLAVYNFNDETTQLYCEYLYDAQLQPFEKVFEKSEELDFIAPFSILPAIPFYAVNQITVLKPSLTKGFQYNSKGKKEVLMSKEFFSM